MTTGLSSVLQWCLLERRRAGFPFLGATMNTQTHTMKLQERDALFDVRMYL